MAPPSIRVSPTSNHSSFTMGPAMNLFYSIGRGTLPPFAHRCSYGFELIMPPFSWRKRHPGVFPDNPYPGARYFPLHKIGSEFTVDLLRSPGFPHDVCSSQGYNRRPLSEIPSICAGGLVRGFSFPRVYSSFLE